MKFKNCIIAFLIILLSFAMAYGKEFQNIPAFHGYTGLLNIPNAYVTDQGMVYAVFNDQITYHRRDGRESAENYMLSFGLLPYLEFGGRLTEEHPEGARDLSAGFKFQIPYKQFFKNEYLPDLAFGIADVGGGSTHFQTRYAVISEQLRFLRLSLGLGNGPDRMDGIFAGAELRLFDWFYLLGEYDTDEKNIGFRFTTPDNLLPFPFNAGLTAKTSLDHEPGDFDLAFSIQIPLGFSRHNTQPLKPESLEKPETAVLSEKKAGSGKNTENIQEPAKDQENAAPVLTEEAHLIAIRKKLIDLGFENVKIGTSENDTLYMEYENNRYNHNELDGLGLAAGVTAMMSPDSLKNLCVVIKEVNVPIIQVKTSLSAYKSFLTGSENSGDFSNKIVITGNIAEFINKDVLFVDGDSNPSRFKPRLLIYPGLDTHIGTEVGVFDYLLSIKPEIQVPVWKGGVLTARWDIPVVWSDEYDDGGAFRSSRYDAENEQLLFHQAFKAAFNISTQFSGGIYKRDYTGILNETVWSPGDGTHRFKAMLGWFRHEDGLEREIWLGSYRYYLDKLDLFLEGTYGQYWFQDRGLTLEMKRYFGDTTVSLFYQNAGDRTGEEAAGLKVSFPLTPRRDMKPGYFQVKGTSNWPYQIRTTIAEEGERNRLNPMLTVIPSMEHSLERAYLNHDRMNERYIKQHLLRLRDAYIKWEN
ncbi:Exopolysaccharide biosynthesis protein domain-containing protein, YbjH-like [Desulfonema limicola]|uniref:Exopolysaccharide biosynthesis protein domain-containing protein, YbjH-like n=1 Tax=Desulfonema limicola TaxID=45656 RepID=A0A975BDI3_9BACT|nr:YjbH domain-containing protein [Desulfonema limicola]QTA83215.1 Exopolysaccharide biosynthesis protein domain-containing protein, YbjH-like [Desulfonema limicola]